MRVSLRNNKGFSLVELMVVVAIITVLAAMAAPSYQRFTAKSKQSEAKSSLSALYSAQRAFFSEWSVFQASFIHIGYQPIGTFRYNHGFNTNIVLPMGHPQATAAAPGLRSTNDGLVCGMGIFAGPGAQCRVINAPQPPGAIPATAVVTATAFIGHARGDIDGDLAIDVWTINERKEVLQVAANDDILN